MSYTYTPYDMNEDTMDESTDIEIQKNENLILNPMELSDTKSEEEQKDQNVPDSEKEKNLHQISSHTELSDINIEELKDESIPDPKKKKKENEKIASNDLPIDQDEEKETMKGSPLPDSELENSNSQEKISSNSKDSSMLSTTDTQDEIEYVDQLHHPENLSNLSEIAKQQLLMDTDSVDSSEEMSGDTDSEDSLLITPEGVAALLASDLQTEESIVSGSEYDEESQGSVQEKYIDNPVQGIDNRRQQKRKNQGEEVTDTEEEEATREAKAKKCKIAKKEKRHGQEEDASSWDDSVSTDSDVKIIEDDIPTIIIDEDDSVQGTDNPVRGTDNPLQGTDNPVEGTDNPVQGTDNPVQGIDNPVQGTDNSVQGTDNSVQGTDNPVQGTDNPVEGTDNPVQGTDNPVQGIDNPVQGTDNPVQGTDNPVEGTDNPVQGTDNPVQGIDNPVQGTDNPVQGTDSPVQGTDNSVQGTDNPVQGTDNPLQGTVNPVQGTDNPVKGTDNPVQDIDKPVQGIDKPKANGKVKPILLENEIKIEKNKIQDNNDCVLIDYSKKGKNKTKGEKPGLRRSSRNVKLRKYSYDEQNVDDDSEEEGDSVDTRKRTSRPIVINDTKSLVQIAARQAARSTASDRREPQLVLIGSKPKQAARAPTPKNTSTSINSSLYQSIVARGTTVTPVPSKPAPTTISQAVQTSPIPPPVLLPSLTDDMFVVEAPSFIVPYVYEKPSIKPFKEFVTKLGEDIEKQRAKSEQELLIKKKEEKLKLQKKRQERKNQGEEVTDTEEEEATREAKVKKCKIAKKEKRHGQEEDASSWDDSVSNDSEDVKIIEDNVPTIIIDGEDQSIQDIKKSEGVPASPSNSYFDGSLGKFFGNIGMSVVEEYVQRDLLKIQKRKLQREKKAGQSTKQRELVKSICLLTKNYEISKQNNKSLKCVQIQCEYCPFKTESEIVLAQHMETPHMKNNMYKCNFCEFEIRSPHDILIHMEAEHKVLGRLERAPASHQCVNCPFEDNGKGKLARHIIACNKKFKPEHNLRPPVDWEPPAKIPKITKGRPTMLGSQISSVSQGPSAPMSVPFGRPQPSMNPFGRSPMSTMLPSTSIYNYRPRTRIPGPISMRPPLAGGSIIRGSSILQQTAAAQAAALAAAARQVAAARKAAAARQAAAQAAAHVAATMQAAAQAAATMQAAAQAAATAQAAASVAAAALANRNHPSISITALPPRPVFPPHESARATFVICEICDGYIKDLEQLRNHMQWIHRVKIHPKMIYNRPPLNCQKCQFRFFTDLGLERHLLGSHALVTASMQVAADKYKDAGRCPICGKVFQWKLLSHMARYHSKTLKPAHLSYKCTVCAASFQMYKLFENHVYSAHSVVANSVMDTVPDMEGGWRPTGLTINDEITITAQPARPSKNK